MTRSGRLHRGDPGPLVAGEGVGAQAERRVGYGDVDEPGSGDLDPFDDRLAAQALGDLAGDLARIALQGLGGHKRAVALEIGQIRPIGGRHTSVAGVEAEGLESASRRPLRLRAAACPDAPLPGPEVTCAAGRRRTSLHSSHRIANEDPLQPAGDAEWEN